MVRLNGGDFLNNKEPRRKVHYMQTLSSPKNAPGCLKNKKGPENELSKIKIL